jgi:macrolide transport system ATP-binding/permease protein
VAYWSIHSITWLIANGRDDFTLHATLNWPVLGFTLALALTTGLIFGLAPAIQATKVDLTPALKETRASTPHGKVSRLGDRLSASQFLVVGQTAVSLLLVIGAGLFVRTVSNLHSVQLGFNQENLLIFSMNARQAGYTDAALARLYGDLLDRLRAIPGVRSAGLSNFPLVSQYWDDERLTIPGAPPAPRPLSTCVMRVDSSFLDTMQIPVVLGRGLEDRDIALPRVVVVNQVFASKFFPNQNPIGRAIGIGDAKDPADIMIVGVAKTSHYNSVREQEIPPVACIPYSQNVAGLRQAFFEVRMAGDPLALTAAVRRVVARTSPGVPLTDMSTQSREIDQTIGQQRIFANLCTCFAVLALLIACVGRYGTMAYAVARRTGEIGIRMALGAQRGSIIWMVMREVVTLASVGLVIGLAAAWETTRFVESFLFGTKPNDPLTISISVLILACAGLAAGYAPAWRASRTDPMTALRKE